MTFTTERHRGSDFKLSVSLKTLKHIKIYDDVDLVYPKENIVNIQNYTLRNKAFINADNSKKLNNMFLTVK